jgi:hypothetical protein
MAGFWDKTICCCGADQCTTIFDGWCFKFSIAGVGNSPPNFGSEIPPCATCADYNGDWLLMPAEPVDTADGVCYWVTCRPPVCCGYPTPVTNPQNRFWMSDVTDNKGILKRWEINDYCQIVRYQTTGPTLSTGSNTFNLVTPPSPTCQGYPATITVTGIPPQSRGSQTRTAQTFTTVGDAPGEPNAVVNGPGPYPWEPSQGPFDPNAGLITPDPYIWNSYRTIPDWLICQNFGFDLPSSYWITGISIQFKRWTDQPSAAFDNFITVGLNAGITDAADPGGHNEAQAGPWPLFSAVPGADIATYGGEFDQWNLGGAVTVATYINTPGFAFAISPNLSGMTSGKAWVDPTTCKMTIYYVLPCTDNCCACPPLPSTGNPPSAYQFTVPSLPAGCTPPNIFKPGCDCASQMGQTYEIPYSALLSVPTYRCVYTGTFGHWTYTLTITNIAPDSREWVLTAGTDSSCAEPVGVFAGGFWVWGLEQTLPNLAVAQCNAQTLVLGQDAFDCFCSLHIVIGGGSFSGPSITVTPIP